MKISASELKAGKVFWFDNIKPGRRKGDVISIVNVAYKKHESISMPCYKIRVDGEIFFSSSLFENIKITLKMLDSKLKLKPRSRKEW